MASLRGLNLSKIAKEIRVHLCQKSPSSDGLRNFIEKNYVNLKKTNPQFPILIRECSGIQPRIYARFPFGYERSVSVENKTPEQVEESLVKLLKSA